MGLPRVAVHQAVRDGRGGPGLKRPRPHPSLGDGMSQGGTKMLRGLLTMLLVGAFALTAFSAYDRYVVFQGGHGAKALGMGGAFTALADDGTGALWNPAGLTKTQDAWLAGATSNLYAGGGFGGMGYQYVAGGFTFEGYAVGISWANATAGPLYSVSAFTGTVGVDLAGLGAVGVNLKYYTETIDNVGSSGFGFDIGLLVTLTDELAIGIAAQDIGGTGLGNGSTILPAYKAGLGVMLLDGALTMTVDVNLIGAFELADVRMGLDVMLIENLGIRAGVVVPEANFADFYFTLGAGVSFAGLAIDAAYVLEQNAGESLVLSASFNFGELFAEPAVETPPAQ